MRFDDQVYLLLWNPRDIVQIAYHLRQKSPLDFATSHNTLQSTAHLTKSTAHFVSENTILCPEIGQDLPTVLTEVCRRVFLWTKRRKRCVFFTGFIALRERSEAGQRNANGDQISTEKVKY